VSNNLLIQYQGFEAKTLVREYTFSVREAAGDAHEFTFTIPNEAFNSRRARFQDAPDICSLKLHGELAANANHPPHTHYRITDAEIEIYHSAHTKPARGFFGRKPERES
jgi:hypothetical protein